MQSTFFSGIKVVEFASVLAGPAVGMFFAELGATVVKIENKAAGGDVTRGWRLPSEDKDAPVSAYFCSVNWGKKHLFLDLSMAEDVQTAIELVKEADVVISNFKPSSAARMGVDAATLRTLNPRLIFAQLHAFADPEDESPAFDVVLQAEAGFLFMCGEPGRNPVRMPVALIDILAAHQLKEAILLALLQREQTGKGALVSTSLLESAIASLANQATNWLMAGHIPQRMGTEHPNIAPYGDIYSCADGRPIVLAVGTERQFRQLCAALQTEELLGNADFQTNTARVNHRQTLNKILGAAIALYNCADLLDKFKTFGVPSARIRDMSEVFLMPAAQSMIIEETMDNGFVTKRVRTNAFKIEK